LKYIRLENKFSNLLLSFYTDPPEFTSVSYDKVVVEGGPYITLECIAIGEPPPNITWTKVLDNGSDSSVLFNGVPTEPLPQAPPPFVLDNNRSFTGIYRCTAFNGIGAAPNRTIAVDVNCKLFSYNMFYLRYKMSGSCCIWCTCNLH